MKLVSIQKPGGVRIVCGTCGKAYEWECEMVKHPTRDLYAYAVAAYDTECDKVFFGPLLGVGDFELDSPQAKPTASGATCVRCKEFYPYAVKVDNFKCYGCKC